MIQTDARFLIVITGPTATGKTTLAAHLAAETDGEVISADSRQVYRGMNIGTGKDLGDFKLGSTDIPYHLIDIADPGEEYNVFAFQKDFLESFQQVKSKGKTAILCGGTGMYIEAAISGYRMMEVKENPVLREKLEGKEKNELVQILASLRPLHNTTDIKDRGRLVRAIEIALFQDQQKKTTPDYPEFRPVIFGIWFERAVLRERITERLSKRLQQGMVEEVEHLLANGVRAAQLHHYGLEYRYITRYVTGEITREAMFNGLNTAIHQFAKRQVTWFRRMERKGWCIHWIDGNLPLNIKKQFVLDHLNNM